MEQHSIIFTIFLIFAGAAIFSTLALYLRQSLLVAYMLFGIGFGPWGFKLVSDVDLVDKVDNIGIIFLMFLLGMHLKPQNLLKTLGKTAWITAASSIIFFIFGFFVGYWCGYSLAENLIIGSCMMFSSTIISLKLLPNDFATRDQYASEVMVSILLLQDLVAIMVLLAIGMVHNGRLAITHIAIALLSLPAILAFVFFVEKYLLKKIFSRFSEVREYMFLVAIAWCLSIAELAYELGLSYEIGAFIAGISIAASPIINYISDQMQPIRDFFLVLFFFMIGASFNLHYFGVIIIPAIILSIIFMAIKPITFRFLLKKFKSADKVSWEIGIRLGQISEFSLLVIFLADRSELVSRSVVYLIQAVTMFMFIASSYLVVWIYPIEKIKINDNVNN